MAKQSSRQNIYTRVTNQIARQLEQGVRPWMKPWNVEHIAGRITRPLRHNAIPYRGVNVLLLWSEALTKGYAAPLWMTYKQSQEMGAQIRKGEQGSLVLYADYITKIETHGDGQDVAREIPFMKGYTVFNVEQVDGLPAHYYAQPVTPLPLSDRLAQVDQFITTTGAAIHLGGNQAYYSPAADRIQLPTFEAFKDKESIYATILHELTHWTRHQTRLDCDFGRQRFGDAGYAREELVAELGSAFLCADLGISLEIREDHADYIGHWLTVLQDDTHAIFQAAAHAQRAADYLQRLQPAPPSDPPSC